MFNRKKDQQDEKRLYSSLPAMNGDGNGKAKEEKTMTDEKVGWDGIPQEVNAYFGKGSKFSGKLSFEGTVRVDGQVEGEVQSNDTLIIGESAEVRANIQVNSVHISGRVEGDVVAKTRIEVSRSGKLMGNIRTPSLVIHEGGFFEGGCSMSTAGTGTREDKKPAEVKQTAEEKVAAR